VVSSNRLRKVIQFPLPFPRRNPYFYEVTSNAVFLILVCNKKTTMNFSMKPFFFGALALSLFFSACKGPEVDPAEETGIFEFNMLARVGGQAFEKDAIYENILGQRFRLSDFRMLVSDLTLVKTNGEDTLLAETLLLNFTEESIRKTDHGEGVYIQFDVPEGEYQGIRFGIGVPSSRNQDVDPTDYASGHPLSPSAGMHWNWITGYKFLVMEGQMDSSVTGTGPLDFSLAYHTGLDELYRELSYTESDNAFVIDKATELQFKFELDVNRFFYNNTDTIDMKRYPVSHTTPIGSDAYQLSEKITDNVVNNAIYKVPF
jgi:hypothetical protein